MPSKDNSQQDLVQSSVARTSSLRLWLCILRTFQILLAAGSMYAAIKCIRLLAHTGEHDRVSLQLVAAVMYLLFSVSTVLLSYCCWTYTHYPIKRSKACCCSTYKYDLAYDIVAAILWAVFGVVDLGVSELLRNQQQDPGRWQSIMACGIAAASCATFVASSILTGAVLTKERGAVAINMAQHSTQLSVKNHSGTQFSYDLPHCYPYSGEYPSQHMYSAPRWLKAYQGMLHAPLFAQQHTSHLMGLQQLPAVHHGAPAAAPATRASAAAAVTPVPPSASISQQYPCQVPTMPVHRVQASVQAIPTELQPVRYMVFHRGRPVVAVTAPLSPPISAAGSALQ